MDALQQLHEEIGHMSPLEAGLIFCIDYITRLEQGGFERVESGYVYRPNFVALTLHYQRDSTPHLRCEEIPRNFTDFHILSLPTLKTVTRDVALSKSLSSMLSYFTSVRQTIYSTKGPREFRIRNQLLGESSSTSPLNFGSIYLPRLPFAPAEEAACD